MTTVTCRHGLGISESGTGQGVPARAGRNSDCDCGPEGKAMDAMIEEIVSENDRNGMSKTASCKTAWSSRKGWLGALNM